MKIQSFGKLLVRRRQQRYHRLVGDVNKYAVGTSWVSTWRSKAHDSLSATIFVVISIASLFFYKNDKVVQALQQSSVSPSPPAVLKQLLQSEIDGTLQQNADDEYYGPILLPCCYDGLTARLIARHEIVKPTNGRPKQQQPQRFRATFMSGFGVSAIHGIPDTQLISYHEMMQTCTIVAEALQAIAIEQDAPYPIPCIAVRIR